LIVDVIILFAERSLTIIDCPSHVMYWAISAPTALLPQTASWPTARLSQFRISLVSDRVLEGGLGEGLLTKLMPIATKSTPKSVLLNWVKELGPVELYACPIIAPGRYVMSPPFCVAIVDGNGGFDISTGR